MPRGYTKDKRSKHMQLERNSNSEGNGSRGKGTVGAVTKKQAV
jgi:hypothetical protein